MTVPCWLVDGPKSDDIVYVPELDHCIRVVECMPFAEALDVIWPYDLLVSVHIYDKLPMPTGVVNLLPGWPYRHSQGCGCHVETAMQ